MYFLQRDSIGMPTLTGLIPFTDGAGWRVNTPLARSLWADARICK